MLSRRILGWWPTLLNKMHVDRISVNGEDFIGLMAVATDSYGIASTQFPDASLLEVPVIKTKLYGTNLVGLFCTGNANGLLLPYFISERRISYLKKFFKENDVDINIGIVAGKYTAIGNLVSCNNDTALISPKFTDEDKKIISDTLDVEIVQDTLAGHDEVGACCVATDNGYLAHPDAEDSLEKLNEIFQAQGNIGSVNFGFPFVKSGLVVNSNGYFAGSRTTGIELNRIDDALGFLD